jgi:hypothetical protein
VTPSPRIRRSAPLAVPFGILSELLPCLATHVDDLCVIRSMVADNINHTGAALQINTGDERFPRPSMGSWLVYGLGTGNIIWNNYETRHYYFPVQFRAGLDRPDSGDLERQSVHACQRLGRQHIRRRGRGARTGCKDDRLR